MHKKRLFAVMVFSFLLQHSFDSMCGDIGLNGCNQAELHKFYKEPIRLTHNQEKMEERKSFFQKMPVWKPFFMSFALYALVLSQSKDNPYVVDTIEYCIGANIAAVIIKLFVKYSAIKSQVEIPSNLDTFQSMNNTDKNKIRERGEQSYKKYGEGQQTIDRYRLFNNSQKYNDRSISEQQHLLETETINDRALDSNAKMVRLQHLGLVDKLLIYCYSDDCKAEIRNIKILCMIANRVHQIGVSIAILAACILIHSKIASTTSVKN